MKGMLPSDQERPHTIIKSIGSGSFGTVYLAEYDDTKEKIAIKKVYQDQRYKNRELDIYKEIKHPNIVNLVNYYYTPSEKENSEDYYLNIVMEFIPETLAKIIKSYSKSNTTMPFLDVKLFSYQMLRSIAYCTGSGICHRDIKPHNILIYPESNILKLIDFGSAKKLQKGDTNIAYICSRYYRAPELSFGATEYSFAIDTWSVGCVIAELLLGKPIFAGESNIDQVVEVIKVLGTPSKQQIKLMNPEYTEYRFPFIKSFPLSFIYRKVKDLPKEYIDLLKQLLCYEPELRLHPLKALAHPFFDELREPDIAEKLPKNFGLGLLFDFTDAEIRDNSEVINKLVPQWYEKDKP